MYRIILFVLTFNVLTCNAQDPNRNNDSVVGGPCEGCEALLEYGNQSLGPVDTLPTFDLAEPQLLLHGTVYQADGESPAEGVIVYIYHTNREGRYPSKPKATGWATRHGYIRGWVKTDATGKYSFYTVRPGAYPRRNVPEHIHMTIKEEGLPPYYIDEIEFLDDEILTDRAKANRRNRAGTGLVMPTEESGILVIERDIFLGRNIPNYP